MYRSAGAGRGLNGTPEVHGSFPDALPGRAGLAAAGAQQWTHLRCWLPGSAETARCTAQPPKIESALLAVHP